MSTNSRLLLLERRFADLGYEKGLRALDWMVAEMCSEKGFARHDGSHYYGHLVDVANDLFNHGIRDEDILTAALLHDAVEDIDGVTLRMVEDKFNHQIATWVDMVTKEKTVNYKQGDLIKVLYLDNILRMPQPSLIKTADRKHNFSTLRAATPEKKMRQVIETETYFFPFFKEAAKKYPRYSAYFLTAKTAILPHLNSIKDHHAEVESLNAEVDYLKQLLEGVKVS